MDKVSQQTLDTLERIAKTGARYVTLQNGTEIGQYWVEYNPFSNRMTVVPSDRK